MGCLQSKDGRGGDGRHAKPPSWDRRDRPDPKDYTIEQMDGGIGGRLPGTINGQQFIIQNCKDARIYLYDHSDSVTVDDCTNCKFFIGPSRGSLFLRNCNECVCVASCGQFRTRDCHNLDVFLCVSTQPIIESSSGVRLACLQYKYTGMTEHFHKSKTSMFNNQWSNIHDFSPVEGESNWSLLPPDVSVDDYLPRPETEEFATLTINTDLEESLVPLTEGRRVQEDGEIALVIFFSDGQHEDRVRKYIIDLRTSAPECLLLHTKQVAMTNGDLERVLGSASYAGVVERGPVIGLHYQGPNVIHACQKVAMDTATATGSTGLIYVSSSPKVARQQIESFFSYADVQMGS